MMIDSVIAGWNAGAYWAAWIACVMLTLMALAFLWECYEGVRAVIRFTWPLIRIEILRTINEEKHSD